MADHENVNRSSALSPEVLAAMTAITTAAVKEAVAATFASLAPALKDMAMTPEKLREINKPYEDPAKAARNARETLLWRQDIEDQRKNTQAQQDNCLHQDARGQSTLRIIRNFPDRQPRGICMHCHALIHPKEWRIGAPNKDNPRGVAYLVEPHKNYQTVMQIVAHEG
jgi:hypothetical protein